ncbi:MAG: PqiC family protein [Candidatus Cloacimonetes bacterium]|nr:PqiC family protein [Candidatus Cloacimonadota bacterium]
MKRLWPPLILTALLLLGCSAGTVISRNYYVLEYGTHTEDPQLVQDEPIDAVVLVTNTSVPTTYDKSRIAMRHFGPRLTYSENDYWALKPSDAVPRLIAMRFNNYRIFRQTTRGFPQEPPPYEISTAIHNIELFKSDFLNQAHIKMDFSLVRVMDGEVLVQHSFDRDENLLSQDMDTFVQMIDEMILAETDMFIRKVLHHFKGTELPDLGGLVTGSADSLAYDAAIEKVGNEMGMLLLPSLSQSENEPPYTIIDKYGLQTTGRMGIPIPLLEGYYSIRFGSGDVNQQMEMENVEVIPGYRRIIEPTWSSLIVDVIDENRDFADVSYEIFRLDTAESYGSEFPADVALGEQENIWVLEPGHYKVTINSEPFNTYKDFTTVFVEEGKLQKLTIVVGTDDDGNPPTMIGAGVLRESELEARQRDLKISSAIHANANFNSDNSTDKNDPSTSITVTTQLDTRLTWDKYPYHFTSKNLMELGTTKDEDTDFRVTSDNFTLKNTFIYYIFHSFGFYVRGDVDANLLESRVYNADEKNYRLIDTDGGVHNHADTKKVLVAPYILPLGFKEGVGINWRVFNMARVNLYARVGFGLRQDINDSVYLKSRTFTDSLGIEWDEYHEVESYNQEGLEFSIESDFRLPFNMRLNSNIDALKPFDAGSSLSMEWENILNMRLIKQLSIDYKLLLTYNKDVVDYVVWNHSLFLRFTYFIY